MRVRFSSPIAASSPRPTFSPPTPGTWATVAARTLSFTPAGAFAPGETIRLKVPAGPSGIRASNGAHLAAAASERFKVADGSVLRLQQLLSQLQYSPLRWTPTGGGNVPSDAATAARAVFSPPAGHFSWRQRSWPKTLTSAWQRGQYTVMTKGMVMAFEADHNLTMDGIAGPAVWHALLSASARHQVNSGGYNYALASKANPETLTIWHNGRQVFHSLANTGIPASPTADGTFPVYERLRSQVMRGSNPDGSHYADPVQYVAYFNGGDAVHYIPRASYGYPQSLGCVELPLTEAATAWPSLTYGTLVTVSG